MATEVTQEQKPPPPSSLGADGKVKKSRTPAGLRTKNAKLRAARAGKAEAALRFALREIARYEDAEDIKRRITKKFRFKPRHALVVLNKAWARIQDALGDEWMSDIARLRVTTQKLIQESLADGDVGSAIKLLKMEADRLGQGGNNAQNVINLNTGNEPIDGVYSKEELRAMPLDKLRALASRYERTARLVNRPQPVEQVIDVEATSRPSPIEENQ